MKSHKEDLLFSEISKDPLVIQYAIQESEAILKDVELKLLVERLVSKHNAHKDKVRKAVLSVLKSMLGC